MTKIMLVEDDKSLREIYGVRLLAEGYDIVSAGDGEEALAMAIKERPQLIVSDVMMPKVSGYDMLDILRSTTETKSIRVIMMTALSSEEQRLRAESLGADRYLVKSQVGIEDVVRVVHEVLEDTPETAAAAQAARTPTAAPTGPATAPLPAQPQTTPQSSLPVANPSQPMPNMPAAPQQPVTPAPISQPAAPASPLKSFGSAPKPASLKTRVIQPLHDPTVAPVNINDLLDKELAKEAGLADEERPVIESADQEKAAINEQLQSFIPPEPTPVEVPSTAQPAPAAPSPSLLPTPGVGMSSPTTPSTATASVATPSAPVVPVATPTSSSTPTTIPVPPAPPTPPVPQAPLTPATHAATPAPTGTTSTIPVAPVSSPEPPVATVEQSSEPVIDLTKLPEVPKVTDNPSV